MKRETIEAICKKLGIPLAPDDDPRYSEPVSITLLSHTDSTPARPDDRSAAAAPTAARSVTSRLTPDQIEANRQHNLQRLAAYDSRAAAERRVKQVEANLRAAAQRARLREEQGDAAQ